MSFATIPSGFEINNIGAVTRIPSAITLPSWSTGSRQLFFRQQHVSQHARLVSGPSLQGGTFTCRRYDQVITGRHGNFPDADLNEAALRRTLARDTIWQGNCDLCGQQLRSTIASVRNTIPIQYPYKQLPCQKKLPSSRCIESAPCSSVSHSSTRFQTARFRYSPKTSGESGGGKGISSKPLARQGRRIPTLAECPHNG